MPPSAVEPVERLLPARMNARTKESVQKDKFAKLNARLLAPTLRNVDKFVKDVVAKRPAELFVKMKRLAKTKSANNLASQPQHAKITDLASRSVEPPSTVPRELVTEDADHPFFARSSESAELSALELPFSALRTSVPRSASPPRYARSTENASRSAHPRLAAPSSVATRTAKLRRFAGNSENAEKAVTPDSAAANSVAESTVAPERLAKITASALKNATIMYVAEERPVDKLASQERFARNSESVPEDATITSSAERRNARNNARRILFARAPLLATESARWLQRNVGSSPR